MKLLNLLLDALESVLAVIFYGLRLVGLTLLVSVLSVLDVLIRKLERTEK